MEMRSIQKEVAVTQYPLEYITNQHNAQIAQLNNQLQIANQKLAAADTDSQAALQEALEKCAKLEAQLAEVTTADNGKEQELEAYRRAERAERMAQERAQQIYTQANAILADATVKAESAVTDISDLAEQAKAQLQAYLDAISSTQELFQNAISALYAIKPENED